MPRTQWFGTLPLVLLGLRSSLKENLHCTTAELVYGTTLRLPGDIFESTDFHTVPDPQHCATQLRHIMQRLQPVPPAHHTSCKPHQNKDLSTCTNVFVCRDAVRRALQPPYDGPFEVLKRAAKFFVVLVNHQQQTISIDCVKPAHLKVPLVRSTTELPSLLLPPPQVNAPVRTTHSGRHVHFPERFVFDIVRPTHWGGGEYCGVHIVYFLCICVFMFCVSLRCFCNLHGITDVQF